MTSQHLFGDKKLSKPINTFLTHILRDISTVFGDKVEQLGDKKKLDSVVLSSISFVSVTGIYYRRTRYFLLVGRVGSV